MNTSCDRRLAVHLHICLCDCELRVTYVCMSVYEYTEQLHTFDVCVTVHLSYNSVNNQLDATMTIYL